GHRTMTRAPYAADPDAHGGREFGAKRTQDAAPEVRGPRSDFQRDRDRVVHSTAFRRLKHKTQVFIYHEGDYFRTRLTHSLEVAQIARTIARTLKIDEDLAETVALAHDLGHPPFGHTGEDVLQDCMAAHNGFDHNAQTLRLLTRLERQHARFDGLNLTWETLEGAVKHNGPLVGDGLAPLPAAIVEYSRKQDLWLDTHASLEAQVAAIADDIAYNNHDIDDGLRAKLFSFDQALTLPLFGPILRETMVRYPEAAREVQIAESVSDLIGTMVDDVVSHTRQQLAVVRPDCADDVRRAGKTLVDFSPGLKSELNALRAFLMKNMYRHFEVNRARSQAKRLVRDLFEVFLSEPETLPPEWHSRFEQDDSGTNAQKLPRIVCDYIAGMTDRFAIREHDRLFGGAALRV
ncbi:MAG: deoxyguanosinetriphosphate triphosphohydrolase, partial [Pseudomonadota bacterium]